MDRKLKRAVVAWLVAGLLLALTAGLALEYLWILSVVPLFIWAAVGVVLFVLAGWRLRHRDQRRAAGAALLAIAVAAFAFSPLATLGTRLTHRARFALQQGRYDQVISTLQDTMRILGSPAWGHREYQGLRYIVEPGPPLRLAFPWPGGILDNWCGAVYDSTGVVLQANKFTGDWDRWQQQVPRDVIRMFGGDMLWCAELETPFYYCCFT